MAIISNGISNKLSSNSMVKHRLNDRPWWLLIIATLRPSEIYITGSISINFAAIGEFAYKLFQEKNAPPKVSMGPKSLSQSQRSLNAYAKNENKVDIKINEIK